MGNIFTHQNSEDPKIILKELHEPNNIFWSKLKGLLHFCCVFYEQSYHMTFWDLPWLLALTRLLLKVSKLRKMGMWLL